MQYMLVTRNQDGKLTGGQMNTLSDLEEKMHRLVLLMMARGKLAHSVAYGLDVVRVEAHSLLPGEEFLQAIERVKRENLQPVLVVTREDLLERE